MVDKSTIRLGLSKVLKQYGIDNLELEINLTKVVREMYGEPAPTVAEAKKTIADAIRSGALESDIKQKIHDTVVGRLSMNIRGIDANDFLEFAFSRHAHGEDIETFVSWWLENNPDPTFWSFNRMIIRWPQAFLRHVTATPQEDKWAGDFVQGEL
jgi:hypothetical protein